MNIKNTLINLAFFAVCGFFLFVTDVSYSASQSGYLFYVKGNNLWVYDLSNETSNQITHLETSIGSGTIANPSISGDGSRIVFSYKTDNPSSETILYSVGYDGSGLENLTSSYNLWLQTKNQLYGALSPDMTKLAFSAEPKTPMPVTGRQLWLKELTGLKRLFQLTFTEGDCNDVQFVDDNHIVFRHKNQSFENYYLISINGTDLTNLTNSETGIYSPRLGRPTLNQSRCVIAYAKQGQSAEGYSDWEIHQLNLQTMAETQILTGMYFPEEQPIDQYDPQPAFIEDSSIDTPLVVFVGKEPFSAVNSLYITAVHSNNPYSIKIPESEGATYPIFYPFVAKPVKFIYTLSPSPNQPDQIYLMDSSNQSLQLISTINSNKDPVFDISGSIIAYAGNGIWKAKADGTDAVQIDTDFNARYPAISPDGMWIAYVKSNDIYVRKTDLSGSAIRLTHSSSTGKMELCFEPSGSAILYTCFENGQQIFSLPINISSNTITVTGEPVNLTKKPGSDNYQPSYSPDGKKIIFISTGNINVPAIYTMNPDGSAVQQISFQSQSIILPCYPQFSPWQNDPRISFITQQYIQQQSKYINIINIANLETGNITQVSPSISPKGKFSWGKDIKNNVSVKRQLPYNRIDGNLPYYYFLDISVNPLNPPSTFIITEELPTISKGACANWKITGVWFNDIPIFPLTSDGNTTGTVKWVVGSIGSTGSIFPLTDGILKLKIEFDGGSVINGSWNFINGNVVDGSMKNMISGDSYTVFGEPNCPADTDGNNEISDSELLFAIDMWASNSRIRGWPIILDDWDFYILKIINFWAGSGYVYAPTATEPLWNTVFN